MTIDLLSTSVLLFFVMRSVKVSIVIPVYNVESYIEECLCSVIEQTYENIECLIVDDCSPDNSIAIAETIISKSVAEKDKYRILHHTENRGLSAARNTGLKEAKGDYVFFLDSDDKLLPEALENLIAVAERYPEADLIQGNRVNEENSASQASYDSHFEEGYLRDYYEACETTKQQFLSRFPVCAMNKLVRRQFLLDNELYFLEGIIHEDEQWRWDLHNCLGVVCSTNKITYWHRTTNECSIMHSKDLTKSVLSKIQICGNVIDNIRTRGELKFINNLLSPSIKWGWSDYYEKETINRAIVCLCNEIKQKRVPISLHVNLWLWRYIPSCKITNMLWIKIHYELSKMFNTI